MARAQRLTRRFPAKVTEAGYRGLRRFAAETGLSEGEALSFLLEHIEQFKTDENYPQRLRLHQAMLAEYKAKGGTE